MNDLRLTGTVELIAAADPSAPKRFTMLAYSGGEMSVGGYGRLVIDGNGVKAGSDPLPILKNHNEEQIVGHGSAKVDKRNGEITVGGVVSGSGEAAREVVANAQNGFTWQASVGAAVSKSEYVEAGAKVRVNGREFVGPLTVVRQSVLREVSFVPIGADAATSASISAKSPRGFSMDSFDEWLAANGYDAATMNDQQRAAIRPAYDAQLRQTGTLTAKRTAAKPSAVRSLVATFQREMPDHADEFASIAAGGLEGGDDEDAIEAKLTMFALRSTGGGPVVQQRNGGSRPAQVDLLTASLLGSCGMRPSEVAKFYDQRTVDAAVSANYRGAGLQTVLRNVLRAAGQHAPDGRLGDDAIRSAFVADRRLQASVTPSTISISGILSNVANKMALASFNGTSATWPKFARRASHSNFHTHTKFRMTAEGTFQELPPGGELKHVTLTEDDKTNTLKTYGALLGIDRRDLINDDLGTLATVPKALGRMGAIAAEKAVYTVLLANAGSFFDAANGNVETGGGSVLAAAGLNAALARFRTQTDSNGDPLLIEPGVLLVPPLLESTARSLMNSTNVVGTTTADTTLPDNNPFSGLAEVVVGSYLATAFGLTNASNAAWYLLCEPGDYSVVEIAFLNAMESPTVQTAELDFDRLGIAMRSYFDFGATLLEHRGGVRSAGS